jgi:molecular chaperone DnaK (HSP70)
LSSGFNPAAISSIVLHPIDEKSISVTPVFFIYDVFSLSLAVIVGSLSDLKLTYGHLSYDAIKSLMQHSSAYPLASSSIEEYAKPNLSPVTVESYERELKNRINPALGKIVLTELKPMHIIHFYSTF